MSLQILSCTIASSTAWSKADTRTIHCKRRIYFSGWNKCTVVETLTFARILMLTGMKWSMFASSFTFLIRSRLHVSHHLICSLSFVRFPHTSMVLTCCARSKEVGSAERAERILLNMESLFSEGLSDVIANGRCYSAAITAWARSNSPDAVDRAFALVDRMEQNGRNGSPHGKPNAHCYNACIHAIAKSQLPGKARRCREVLLRMEEQFVNGFHESTPSYITYSTIINGGCD